MLLVVPSGTKLLQRLRLLPLLQQITVVLQHFCKSGKFKSYLARLLRHRMLTLTAQPFDQSFISNKIRLNVRHWMQDSSTVNVRQHELNYRRLQCASSLTLKGDKAIPICGVPSCFRIKFKKTSVFYVPLNTA